jgi:hypothetical protein
MIGRIFSAIAWRRGRSAGILLLGLWAGILAAVGPAFLSGADQSVITQTLAARESLRERDILVDAALNSERQLQNPNFASLAADMRLDGFDTVYQRSFYVLPSPAALKVGARLEYRTDMCEHLVLKGRCPTGVGEVLVSERVAKNLGVTVGSVVPWTPAFQLRNPEVPPIPRYIFVPTGDPRMLTVVGTYVPMDPAEPYWAGQQWESTDFSQPPLFAGLETTKLFEMSVTDSQSYLLLPSGRTLTASQLETLHARIDALKDVAQKDKGVVTTTVDPLLQAVAAERATLRQRITAAMVVLGVIIFMLGYLIGASEAGQRRRDHGMLRLHGVPARERWTLALGAMLVPLAIGFAGGAALTPPAVRAIWHLPGVHPDTRLVLGFGLGLAIVVGIAFAAAFHGPTLDLLRGGLPRRRWIAGLIEFVGVALALLALLQLRSQVDRPGSAIEQIAPALLVLVGAAVLARAGIRLMGGLGRWWLRRGRIGLAVAALHVGRGRIYRSLLVMLGLAVGFVMLTAGTVDIGQTARDREATVAVGADRVIAVQPADPGHLISVVESIDPEGSYAMAVGTSPKFVAVDAVRLSKVASWPAGPGDLPALSRQIHPWPGTPVRFFFSTLLVTIDADLEPGVVAWLSLSVVPVGTSTWTSEPIQVTAGKREYRVPVSLCGAGCRLFAVNVALSKPGHSGRLVISSLREADSGHGVGTEVLADARRWTSNAGTLEPGDGLVLAIKPGEPAPLIAYVDEVPGALPLVSVNKFVAPTVSFGSSIVPVREAGRTRVVPRLVGSGALLDLNYLDLMTSGDAELRTYEVWLNRDAPADMAQRLRDKGMPVLGERSLADVKAAAGDQAIAVGNRVGAIGVGLGAAACVFATVLLVGMERRRHAAQLNVLAVQGLKRRVRKRLRWLSYAMVSVSAVVIGPLLAALAFVLLDPRARMGTADALTPLTPQPRAMAIIWGITLVLLVLAPMVAVRGGGTFDEEG